MEGQITWHFARFFVKKQRYQIPSVPAAIRLTRTQAPINGFRIREEEVVRTIHEMISKRKKELFMQL